ncbi:MAG TPA: outer membrane protein assembly factor BamE [Burkholderiaceae bacterium]|nr:outer membrane protein assembly factor BamE [Burkholderiaceae bacterium]
MNIRILLAPLSAILATLLLSTPAFAQRPPTPALAQPEGFLCCNMRTDGKWISDSNYADNGQRLIPLGSPTKVTGYGRYRVHVTIDGSTQAIGNDYSRDIPLDAFAKRYVVAEDPRIKLAAYPAKVRETIEAGRVRTGMTREQVLMSLGYPITSENPQLDASTWRYWQSSFAEYQVVFDGAGRVKEVIAAPTLKRLVSDE